MAELHLDLRTRNPQWKRLLLLLAMAAPLAFLDSCGSSNSSSTSAPPSVTVSCATTQVIVLGTSQCTASVLNLSSTLVTWSVSGTGTGNFGSIDSKSGLYTAPATQPTNNIVTIKAVSQADNTTNGTTTITIEPAVAIAAINCVDPLTGTPPTPLIVASGNNLDCTATATGGAVVSVSWTVANANNLGGGVGSINPQTGVYAAPLVPPPGGAVTITATPTAVSTNTMSVTATVVFGNRVLSGAYVFSTSGRVVATNTFFTRVGSFTAGGGSLSGIEDKNEVGQAPNNTFHTFTGTYSIDADGRGTMQFCEDTSASCTAPTASFSFAVVSPQQVQIIEFSKPGTSVALRAGSGEILSQPADASLFNNSGLSGTYSFSFDGVSSSAIQQSEVGEFTADGFGHLNTAGTPARMDVNTGGTLSSQSFSPTTYVIPSNGRGTVTIGSSTFSVYLVSASQAKFIETDATAILVGDAFQQQSQCSWGNNTLQGTIVLGTGGTKSGSGIADLISFTASGTGGATSVSIDEGSGGVLTSTSSPDGKYSIDTCGRGMLGIPATTPTHNYIFYMREVNKAVVQEVSSGVVAQGTLLQPQAGPFTAASVNGSYTIGLAGSNGAGALGNEEDLTGQLSISGASTSQMGGVTEGSVDIDNNTNGTNLGKTQTLSEAGSYSVASGTGRVAMTLSFPQNLVLYIVSPSQALAMIGNDNTNFVAAGSLYKQF